jgi:predicted RNase H-like nuclease
MSQLSRTVDYAAKLDGYRELTSLLTDTAGEEVRRLEEVRSRLPGTAAILPLDGPTLGAASEYQRKHALDPRDALVYASVALHLEADGEASCFLTRDAKDFGDPGLIAELAQWGCKVLHRFETGLGFVRGQLGADEHA